MNEPKTTKQAWLSAISSMFQFILGFVLGVSLIAAGVAGGAYYYFKKVSSSVPKKPIYTSGTPKIASSENQQTAVVETEQESKPQPEVTPVVQNTVPEGAYYANVTWPQGLSLRAEPSINAQRIGGIGYNARILILKDSQDKKWQRVQLPGTKQEGWVKAGNIKRASD